MSKKRIIIIILSTLVMISLACNLSATPTTVSEPGQAPAVPLDTQVAAAIAATAAFQTAIANAAAGTQAALPSTEPGATLTPSLTPTETLTSTPSIPMVTVTQNTNCRSGPTTAYDLLGVMMVGEKAEVVGRSTLTDTMIIKLPSNPSIICWLWAQNATVSGDINTRPIFPIPATPTPKATPTPAPSFKVQYDSTLFCVALHRHKFKITNDGEVTWESVSVTAVDESVGVTKTLTRNDFFYYVTGCGTGDDQNLDPGEVGYAMSDGFAVIPTGHNITATIRVCSQDGMTGICLEKTITFVP